MGKAGGESGQDSSSGAARNVLRRNCGILNRKRVQYEQTRAARMHRLKQQRRLQHDSSKRSARRRSNTVLLGVAPRLRRSRLAGLPYGMTLVEMLMALAMMALILAIVLPLLGHARLEARRSNCAGNMHQCALALNMYLEDYDNVFPTYRVDAHNAARPDDLLFWHDRFCRALLPLPGQQSWVTLTRPYVTNGPATRASQQDGNRDVFHCSDDNDQRAGTASYEFKMQLAAGFALADLHLPAATAMLWEQWAFHDASRYSEYDRRAELNVAFADGHAGWLRLDDTTNARYGKGPDLHWLPGEEVPPAFQGEDVPF